jgi:hypothetical protein
MAPRLRLVDWYHNLFRIAQTTMHDPWVKRLRLVAFLAATSIATQIVLHSALESVGLGNLLPSSVIIILVASAVWLIAYPTMWFRMIIVLAEMEAKKEFEVVVHEVERLHHRPAAKPVKSS